ncbi:MAG TPA: MFS transporter [Leptolyngbyaceae cyanobacterium]
MKRKTKEGSPERSVLWWQVCGLAAMQGAITLTWLIYSLYLPQLLVQFGFSKQLAAPLLIIENALAVVMEPLMGGLSDRLKRWVGSRLPLISAGIVLSSALFIAIPLAVIFGQQAGVTRAVLLAVLLAWALAMTVFRSPAISLLAQYATPTKLPLAASLLTLAAGIIGAFKPIASQFLLSLGAVFTFAIGSFVLLGTAAVLRWLNSRDKTPEPMVNETAAQPTSFYVLGLIFITAAAVTWGTRFLMGTLPQVLKIQLDIANVDWLMVGIAIALAFAALPAGGWAASIGNSKAMLIGIGVTVGLLQVIVFIPTWFTLGASVVCIIASLSLVVNSAIPFALTLVRPQQVGLASGMYFGGVAAAVSLFGLVFPLTNTITPVAGAIGGAISFLLAALCLAASFGVQPAERTIP